jgi:hypothetical protein
MRKAWWSADFERCVDLQRLRAERRRDFDGMHAVRREQAKTQLVLRVRFFPADSEKYHDGVMRSGRRRDAPAKPKGVDLPHLITLSEVREQHMRFHAG